MLKIPITELTVGESIINALFLMLLVFLLLGALMLLVRLMSAIVIPINNAVQTRKQAKTADAPLPALAAAVSTTAPSVTPVAELPREGLIYTGTLRLRNVDEPTAAMVMAIVSDQSGIPLSQLEFKAIRKLED